MASMPSYQFGDFLDTYRYTLYIRGPARDITAGVVEVVLNVAGFNKTIHRTLELKNLLVKLNLDENSDTQKIIARLKEEGMYDSELKEYCSNRTVKEKLEDIEVYQNLKTKEKRKVDDANENLKENDITFLFWIFDKIWNKVHGQGGNLWDLMKRVKDERNAVSHEDIPLTTQELEVKLKSFGTPLNDLVTEALNLYPDHQSTLDHLTDLITESVSGIKERVREPLDPCSSEDYKIFLEETKNFAGEATKEIQEESKRELDENQVRHCKTALCDWLTCYSATDTSNISVPLEVDTEKEFHPFASHINRTVIDQKNIFKAKSPSGEEPSAILLSGEAGAGKTTLLSLITEHFVKRQDHGFERLLDNSFLIYTEFRNTRLETLDQYFQEVLATPVSKYGLQNVKAAIFQKQMLFLCDGFDEQNPKSLNLFQEILEIPSPNVSKILVTTRPNCSNDLTKLVNKSKKSRINLKVLPLNEMAVIECMKKVVDHILKDDPIKRAEATKEIISTYKRMTPEIQNIMKVPLYNSLITTLLLSEPQLMTQVNTISKLFQVIRENDRERVLDKCQGTITEVEMKSFETLYNKRAIKNHLEQRHEISSDDVEAFKKCFKDNQCFHNALAALCNSKHSKVNLKLKTVYCHRHRLEQEFSAALAITNKILEDESGSHIGVTGNPIINYLNDITQNVTTDLLRSMNKITTFIPGILSDKPDIMKKYAQDIVNCLFIDEDEYGRSDISPLMDILSESQYNGDILDVIASKCLKENKLSWKVEDALDLTGLEVLIQKIKPKKLLLHFSIDPETVGHLMPTLEAAGSSNVILWSNFIKQFYEGNSYGDGYLRARRNVEFFGGCLKDLSCIPHNIQYLDLHMKKEQLPTFNNFLPKMTDLLFLNLLFDLEDVENNRCLISKEYKGDLRVIIDTKRRGGGGGGGGDGKGQKMADVFNSLWPENQRRRKKKNRISQVMNSIFRRSQEEQSNIGKEDSIMILNSYFERKDIISFINCLDINHLKIWINNVIGVTEDDEQELQQICLNRSFGELKLWSHDAE